MDWLFLAPIAGFISILAAVYLYFYVNKQSSGNEKMREIADAIKEGGNAYLRRQSRTLAIFVVIVAVILAIAFRDYKMPMAYVIGSVFSALAGYFGLNVAVKANVRTSNASGQGINKAFPIAFYGGSVMGLLEMWSSNCLRGCGN
jgi:K(+)-stimulated pyrophosphate-energized sodium pump